MNLLCCCCCGTMAPNTRVTRKWELYAGRNKFYCDGLLMSAPHTGVFYLTCVLITGTSALFFAYDCPFLATRITPAIPIVGAVLYFFTMSSLLRTTFTDPGVIPRASHDEAAYIEKQIEVPNSLNSPTYRPPPRTKEVLVKGQTVKLKYCFTCKIFRPPRASHCSLCDNCVDRFDHHCPWVGNCVGKRNYRFFYMFLVSLAFLAVFIFSCSVTHLVLLMKTEQEVFEVIKKAPFTVIVVFICFFSIWSVIGLAGFHTYLTTSDQTTNEDLKGSFSSKGGQRAINPYSRGNICLNCCHILCGPMTPSLIDRRGIATDEYILQMQQSSSPRHPLSDVISATHVSSAAMITNQPMLGGAGGGIGIGGNELKPRLYDESNPNSSTLGGVYRPRSYDNLQNGNSNSLAHLVDNEIPLSQLESPQTQTIQQPHSRQHQQQLRLQLAAANGNDEDNVEDAVNVGGNINMTDVVDIAQDDEVVVVDNSEVIAAVAAIAATHKATQNSNNMSGSYSNLFNAEYDSSAATTPATSPNAADAHKQILSAPDAERTKVITTSTGRYYKGPQSGLLAAAIAGNLALVESMPTTADTAATSYTEQHMLAKSISQTENMYSNVPHANVAIVAGDNMLVIGGAQQPTTPTEAAIAAHNSISPIVESQALHQHDPSLHVYSNLIEERQQLQQPQQQQQQQQQQHTQQNQQYAANNIAHVDNSHTKPAQLSSSMLSDDLDLDDPVSASFVVHTRSRQPATSKLHAKRKIGVELLKSTTATLAATSANIAGDCKPHHVTTELTPSRLRLLHDTTMIDTALDLDSLDGSSLGNNSQVCLVKQQNQQKHPIA